MGIQRSNYAIPNNPLYLPNLTQTAQHWTPFVRQQFCSQDYPFLALLLTNYNINTTLIQRMRAFIENKQGKENDKLNIRSNKRKQSKSPIKFQQRIKELQQKMQKDIKKKSLAKQKACSPLPNSPQQLNKVTKSPIQLFQPKYPYQANSPQVLRQTRPVSHGKVLAKTQPKQARNGYQNIFITNNITNGVKMGPKVRAKQNDQAVTQLKQDNQRYKQIYSKSLEKMQSLQAKLANIKEEHQIQNGALQVTLNNLKRQVEEKKPNTIHGFSFKQLDFMLIRGEVIGESEHQSSSDFHQYMGHGSFACSSLSIESKQIF